MMSDHHSRPKYPRACDRAKWIDWAWIRDDDAAIKQFQAAHVLQIVTYTRNTLRRMMRKE